MDGWNRVSRSTSRRGRTLGLLLLGLTLTFPERVAGQMVAPRSPEATKDAYGNARASYVGHRPVGTFENQWRRSLAGGYPRVGTRAAGEAGYGMFRLPGDVRRSGLPIVPFLEDRSPPKSDYSRWMDSAFRRYGGFGDRYTPRDGGGLLSTFERRRALIAATTLNAPIHRANSRFGTRASLGSTVSQTPFLEQPDTDEPRPPASVNDRLALDVANAHERIRGKAWSWFNAGEYRLAARAFETAILMDSSDTASRLGQIVSHVSLGELRTATAVLRTLLHRVPAPFYAELDFASAYGSPEELRRVRTLLATRSSRDEADIYARALDVLVLWYLGGRSQAELRATGLAGDAPGEVFAQWPEVMRSAAAPPPLEAGTPQP